jgi:hypothetical protein
MDLEISLSDETQSVILVVLKDRLNMRGLLRRKNMQLDSYTCEMCLLQEVECQAFVLKDILS